MVKIFLFTFGVILLFTNSDCKKDPVTSPIEDIKPGRRDYLWTVDTLYTKPGHIINAIWRIWGSSSDNVWMIASADEGYTLWHYDGNKWIRDSTLFQISPSALFGLSENDVWMSNRSSGANLWHYDGLSWKFFSQQQVNGFDYVILQNIYGETANNVFATGFAENSNGNNTYRGILFNYNGVEWSEIKLPTVQIGFVGVIAQKKDVYLYGYTHQSGYSDSNKIYLYANNSLKQIYSGIEFVNISKIGGQVYIEINKIIYLYDSNTIIVHNDFSQTDYLGGLSGRTEKDLFAVGKNGLLHYNGSDIITIFPTSYTISSITTFQDNVFFGLIDLNTRKNMIVRGVLSN